MSENIGHNIKEYICMDGEAETLDNRSSNEEGALFYPVRAKCGSLRCPPYKDNTEVLCTVYAENECRDYLIESKVASSVGSSVSRISKRDNVNSENKVESKHVNEEKEVKPEFEQTTKEEKQQAIEVRIRKRHVETIKEFQYRYLKEIRETTRAGKLHF
ncbi:unnamed protein product [Mytilus edulis]|uniref:Uncharacterized protein n=1 Tax=Mytilus edulis TaxID=6550 RepID=A0A8S3RPQ8_MYTED|nr:unnamed protein product [Mytilus edulis]